MTGPFAPAAFAIPGDITTLTGGYIYERRLLDELRAQGRPVRHIQLGGSFPAPTPAHMADAVAQLQALGPGQALILDGLAFGSLDTAGLAGVRAPVVAMVHHPLALESGLSAVSVAHLFRTERDNLALAQHVLVPSPHTAELLSAEYGVPRDRITIARPGTDRPTGTQAPVTPPLILSVGIQHPRKGHDILIAALTEISDLDWQAVIVGSPYDPEHAEALRAAVRTSGVSDRIRLAGRVDAADLETFYEGSTIFALATRFEGYGIVFDEALAHGLPIVSCHTGAVPDTVPPGTGLLVPPEDPVALAKGLRQVLSDNTARLHMSEAAARAGAALPSWADTAQVAGSVLDRVLE